MTLAGTSGMATSSGIQISPASSVASRCMSQTASMPPASMIIAIGGEGAADERLALRGRDGAGGQGVHQAGLPSGDALVEATFAALRSSSGSAEWTIGTSTKLSPGAGDVVVHSSVWASHGSSPIAS